MGEVYKAQDTELGRHVALKFLASEVAAHQSRLQRFIQEAKAASALNHPNILTVYEIGRADGTTFIATEFVEGLTLRQHMYRRLKLTEVLEITIQIASALVAAHAAGIVHRDIKPENIMVRQDGIVKLLDFGLAKLTERQESTGPEATTAIVHTEPGSVLGTAAYMSPEQAAGREVDARSDIWSLGVVLYEMVAAHAPFAGASKSHIIVAIIDHEPRPITQFAPDVPEPLEWLIAEALTKDREERIQTAKEMLSKLKRLKQRIESGSIHSSVADFNRSTPPQSSIAQTATIEGAAKQTAQASELATQVITPVRRRNYLPIAAIVLGLITVGMLAFALSNLLNQPPKVFEPAKLTALTTGGKVNDEDINGQVTISPDGKYVVTAANDSKQQASLWIRQVSTGSLVRIVPPEVGGFLGTTFTPDGEQIYYVARIERDRYVPTLYRVPFLGGTSTKVLDHVYSAIGFSPDGKQFAFVRINQADTALMVANTDGSGQPKTIATRKQPDGFSYSGPGWSPDGKRIACGIFSGAGTGYASVVEVPVVGGEPIPIGAEKWANIGRVIWVKDGSGMVMTALPEFSSLGTQLWFLPYPAGQARRITNDLNAYGDVSLGLTSDSSTIATIQQINSSGIWITALNEGPNQAQQILKTSLPDAVVWTPDGRIVYASRTGENWDIWSANRDGSDTKQLTSDAFIDQQPSVSVDGRYIVFQSNRSSGARNIWRIDIDGSNLKQLTDGNYVDSLPVVSVDGRWVIFESERSGSATLWKVSIDGGAPLQLINRPSRLPAISPDGKQIAYYFTDARENNQPKVSIIPFEGGEPVKTINLPRTVQPLQIGWLPDGRSIAYLDNQSGILNVWSQSLDDGAVKQLTSFKTEFVSSFAITPDGKVAVYRFSATRDIVLIKDFR